ncbi:MAG: transaldolase [Candidatus Levybacteria bacterium]|nr:transaldolase [Candidatus Levybacteria bacterium]
MNINSIKTRLFLDSADPNETTKVLDLIGHLDGQTTNPTLAIKNPSIKSLLNGRDKVTREELLNFYKDTVGKISKLIPKGFVSIEVYADKDTTANEMFFQAKEMNSWIPNAHIKFPINREGLIAARRSIDSGIRVNMTLCFSQEQAAAVYCATKGAKKGDVFVSPFVGRLDDIGESGMDLIKNIIKMFEDSDGHVEVLTASIRSIDHLKYAIKLGSDIITAPAKIYEELTENDLEDLESYEYKRDSLLNISYKELNLENNWDQFDIKHTLTDKGIEKFSSDWNSVISS